MAHNVVDVDDLLDEIEGSLKNKTAPTANRFKSGPSGPDTRVTAKTSDASDLLKSLDEIDTEAESKKVRRSNPPGPSTSTERNHCEAPTLKCRTIFLSGPKELEYGHCSLMQERACDNLHCMKCDFQVLLFKGQHWVSSVTYMFFRNFMPDRQNLSKKLSKAADHTAYCCQCSWISVSSRKSLSQTDSFQWCCNSHNS